MPRFSTAPIAEVVPQRKQRQPSQRAQTQREYQEALRHALLDEQEALVIELDPEDKPLTIRNRIKRASEALGLDGVAIRRRKDRIVAYLASEDSGGQ